MDIHKKLAQRSHAVEWSGIRVMFALADEIEGVVNLGIGQPDFDTPEHIREKLVESAQKTKTHGYSTSKGIPKLLMAISDWYKRRYDCDLDPMTETVATMGSKEGYAHLCYAITNPGDVAVVPDLP